MTCSNSKRVILTGATGLIGKETITPLVDAGFQVYALSTKKQKNSEFIHWIQVDLFLHDEIKKVFNDIKPTYLLHFAWCTSGDYLASEDNYKFLESSLIMLHEFKKNGGKRAVMAGTCFEYEVNDFPIKEGDKLNPKTIYAKSKNELRKKAQFFCENNDISFAWGRIFYVYGNGENKKRLTPSIIESLRSDKEFIVKNGRLIRDYMYAKDVAGAFVSLLNTNVFGCVNICTGIPISISEYAKNIAKIMDKEYLLKFTDAIEDQPKLIVGDNTKLLNSVGYALRYNFDIGLKEVIG